jgi:tRNA(Ile)-lysidine synthase
MFNIVLTHEPCAIALSGGADSWALALMAQEQGVDFTALTVDHKLRADSTAEAQVVAAECARRGIKHHILTWQHDGIETRLQERARTARYALLFDWCRVNRVQTLLTGHHADDQAETILMRFAHASDVAGLAGLRPVTARDGITIMRPLLDHTKQQLIDYVVACGVPYVTDVSNANPHFARGRLRASYSALAAEGLTTDTLLKLGRKMHAADEALDWATQQHVLQYVERPNIVVWRLPLAALAAVPLALRIRALQTVWRIIRGPHPHPLDYEIMLGAANALDVKRTFGGIVFEPQADGFARLYREAGAITEQSSIAPHASAVWDGRFTVTNNSTAPITITALGAVSAAQLEKTAPWALNITPAAARAALPACNGTPAMLGNEVNSDVYAVPI